MKTFLSLTLSVMLICSACKSSNTKPAETTQTQTQTKTETPVTQDKAKLQKWPADYPVTGDSVGVITVQQKGKILGDIVVEFYPDKAPNHVRNFKWLADNGFYNGVIFHRVIKDFMLQGGDPTGTGSGGPGWTVNAEFNDVKHTPGILSMARTNDPNSAGSQFFIMHNSYPSLDNKYTVFGKVIKGIEIVNEIATTPTQPGDRPTDPVAMTNVKIVPRSSIKL